MIALPALAENVCFIRKKRKRSLQLRVVEELYLQRKYGNRSDRTVLHNSAHHVFSVPGLCTNKCAEHRRCKCKCKCTCKDGAWRKIVVELA